jgi:hypothetical protein
MSNLFLKLAVRTLFALASREQVSTQIQKLCDRYLLLAAQIDTESGSVAIHVPKMVGIDEDMRDWSFFKILEHNTIVNRSITSIIESLVRGEEPEGAGAIDMKKDVMPSENPGTEQIESFRSSVAEHIRAVSDSQSLRDSPTKLHPIFGAFTAHQWHCMFGFHLLLHYKQAKYIINKVTEKEL